MENSGPILLYTSSSLSALPCNYHTNNDPPFYDSLETLQHYKGEVLGVLNQVQQLSTFSAYPVGLLLAYSISVEGTPQGGAGVGVSWTVACLYLLIAAAVQLIYGTSTEEIYTKETEAERNEEKNEKEREGDREKEGEKEREAGSRRRKGLVGTGGYSRRSVLVLERRMSKAGAYE